ncbi:MAG: glycoside hydrolase family 3 protein, partial [Deltaproteobacteria bacterium]|nr:glycoside hydrolase family 3 protein [Deltaproteobacteria bacterium]
MIGKTLNTTLELSELNRTSGRIFMTGMPGTILDEDTEAIIRDYSPAGVILFSRNIEDPLQLAGLCRDLQAAAMKYHGVPLFISVDQEGGMVARLKSPFTIFPGNEVMGNDENPLGRAEEFGRITAYEMKMVGLNMDLAPVLDVRKGATEKHLIGRTFSDNHRLTAKMGAVVIKTLQAKGIMAVAKHFPGLGRAGKDPHFHLPVIKSDRIYIDKINLTPFRSAVRAGVSGIMTSHALYPSLDPENPATLSPVILGDLLRGKMRFRGLIITDDLEMGAITGQHDVAQGALNSFQAGADILLICKDQKKLLDSICLIRN